MVEFLLLMECLVRHDRWLHWLKMLDMLSVWFAFPASCESRSTHPEWSKIVMFLICMYYIKNKKTKSKNTLAFNLIFSLAWTTVAQPNGWLSTSKIFTQVPDCNTSRSKSGCGWNMMEPPTSSWKALLHTSRPRASLVPANGWQANPARKCLARPPREGHKKLAEESPCFLHRERTKRTNHQAWRALHWMWHLILIPKPAAPAMQSMQNLQNNPKIRSSSLDAPLLKKSS